MKYKYKHKRMKIRVTQPRQHCQTTNTFLASDYTYLIFVIFFTQARFLENKIYTEERVNYDKRILRQNSVNRDLLGQANYKDQDYTKFVTHSV